MIYDLMRILKFLYSIVLLSHPLFETHLQYSQSKYQFLLIIFKFKNLESFDPQLLSSCFQFDF